MDLSQKLNPSQLKAVQTIDKPMLVIAGAGSGKTRVIEYKVLHLIQNNIKPSSILLLTFTKKAAHEMLTRVSRHDPRCQQIEGGTFHSFAYKLLKRYAQKIGISNSFSILDQSDSTDLINRCMTKLNLYDIKKRFPQKQTLLSIISKSINKSTSIKSILESEFPQFEEFNVEIKKLAQIYAKAKIDANYLDYDDLLIYLKILLENGELRQKIASNYNYIMVDEYQDTNKLQGDITYLLAESHGNIMVVGDDAQSIYGFRGANHQNIMQFPNLFPGCQIIKLEENYRSTQEILDISNSILDNMSEKYEKKLHTNKKDIGLKPQLLAFKNPYEEAEWIAAKIKTIRDEGTNLGKQAVLFRSAYISIPLQAELNKLNIPFKVYGGLKFYETAHVKDLLSYFKILINPKDELSWLRLLQLLEGIGTQTAEKIVNSFQNLISLNQVLDQIELQFCQNFKYSSELKKLLNVFKSIDFDNDTVSSTFEKLFKHYLPILKRNYDEWQNREDDLHTLLAISQNYATIDQFIADLTLEPPQQGVAGIDPQFDDETPLTLSTIHSAKGLEWDTVFVLAVIDGILPSRFAVRDNTQIDEEHRLFYVAVTRAKTQLYLTMHHEGSYQGLTTFNRLSRFVEKRNVLEKLEQNLIEIKKRQEYESSKVFKKLIGNQIKDMKNLTKEELFKKINESWKL